MAWRPNQPPNPRSGIQIPYTPCDYRSHQDFIQSPTSILTGAWTDGDSTRFHFMGSNKSNRPSPHALHLLMSDIMGLMNRPMLRGKCHAIFIRKVTFFEGSKYMSGSESQLASKVSRWTRWVMWGWLGNGKFDELQKASRKEKRVLFHTLEVLEEFGSRRSPGWNKFNCRLYLSLSARSRKHWVHRVEVLANARRDKLCHLQPDLLGNSGNHGRNSRNPSKLLKRRFDRLKM